MLNSSFSAIEKESKALSTTPKAKDKKRSTNEKYKKEDEAATDQRNEKRLGNQLRLKSVNWYQARQTYTLLSLNRL